MAGALASLPWRSLTVPGILACLGTFYAARKLAEHGHGGIAFAGSLFCLFLYLIPYFFYGFPQSRQWFEDKIRDQNFLTLTGVLLVPYVIYGVTTWTFSLHNFLTVLSFCITPLAFCELAKRQPTLRLFWLACGVAAIWLPFDFDIVTHLWPWPEGNGAYVINVILAVDVALIGFITIGKTPDVGYWLTPQTKGSFGTGISDLEVTVKELFSFCCIGIPLAFAIGFITFNPSVSGPIAFFETFLGIFLTIALPEELLFRGLFQNLLGGFIKRRWHVIAIAAIVFGAAHLNNGPPLPNYSFFLLATIAGVFYGRAFVRTKGLLAPSLIHALVDALWVSFFAISAS